MKQELVRINSVDNIALNGGDVTIVGKTFMPGKEYTPTFEMLAKQKSDYDVFAEDSVLIYDYKLEIDHSRISDESVRKYGLDIVNNDYQFVAHNEAVIGNTVPLIYNYILINGQKGSCKFEVSFNDEEIVAGESIFLESYTAKFDAEYNKTTGWFEMSKTLSLDKFFEELGDAGYDKWIDALARNLQNTTDPDEAALAVFNKKTGAGDNDFTVELLGGDPINNQGTQDVAAYNAYLLKNYIDFDYVDKDGKSCTANIKDNIERLKDIVGLKVTFKADKSISGEVKVPYYTPDGKPWSTDGKAALPLNNEFRVEITTRAEQLEVSKMNFTFELQQPTMDITPDEGNFSQWTNDPDTNEEILLSYGAYGENSEGRMYLPLYESFKAWTKEYTEYDDNAKYYTLYDAINNGAYILGKEFTLANHPSLDPDLKYTTVWSDWNTYANGAQAGANNAEKSVMVTTEYHHYGVYPEDLFTDGEKNQFRLVFASLLKNSDLKMAAGYEKLIASADKNVVFISDEMLNLTTPKNQKFYLFDGLNQGAVITRAELNRNSFNENQRPFIDVNDLNKVVTAKDKNGSTTHTVIACKWDKTMWRINPQTGERYFDLGDADAKRIKVYNIPAYPVVNDPTHKWSAADYVQGYTGGLAIQLPESISDKEEIEITITLNDDLEFTNELKFTVSKLQ